ncbi:sigma factor-like helix-turn-helix DNA-binding protein [Streptomyces sp. NPDC012438]|uniref:RNA polymerase sigma factor n=1 Tax=Streptomyces sp. NPDC012438 TaxID=3364833 RepID=UPI0036E280D5
MGTEQGRTPDSDVADVYREKRQDLLRHARFCLARAGIPESRLDPDDLLHEAVVVTMANQAREPIHNLAGYMYSVITHRVGDERRRIGTATPVDTSDPSLGQARYLHVSDLEEVTPEGVADRVDLEAALGKLPEQQKRMVTLAKGLGYTHTEIATITGLHAGTVAQHVRRGTSRLAVLMQTGVGAAGLALLVFLCASGTVTWKNIPPAGRRELTDEFEDGIESLLGLPYQMWVFNAAFILVVGFFLWRNVVAMKRDERHQALLNRMEQIEQELLPDMGRMPTVAEYSSELEVSEEDIEEAMEFGRKQSEKRAEKEGALNRVQGWISR